MARDEARDEAALEDFELENPEPGTAEAPDAVLRCPYCRSPLPLSLADAQDGLQVPCTVCRATSLVLTDPIGMPGCWIRAD